MAGDWIKMRTSLLTNPKVNGIARELECSTVAGKALSNGYSGVMSEIVTRAVMRHVTVSSLLVLWGAANEHTKDGVFSNADLSDIDDMTGIPGFGDAMAVVGWAVYDAENQSVTLPNFTEYNTSGSERSVTAKSNAQRQKEYRDRQPTLKSNATDNVTSNATSNVTSNRREEKRREDNKDSVAKATGGKPPLVTDPDEIIFGYGLPMLTNSGTPEKQARSFLGGLRKHHGDGALIDKLRECAKAKPLQPLEWLAAALPPAGSKPKPNTQEALEASNAAIAARFLES
jgi:hypothetical protein